MNIVEASLRGSIKPGWDAAVNSTHQHFLSPLHHFVFGNDLSVHLWLFMGREAEDQTGMMETEKAPERRKPSQWMGSKSVKLRSTFRPEACSLWTARLCMCACACARSLGLHSHHWSASILLNWPASASLWPKIVPNNAEGKKQTQEWKSKANTARINITIVLFYL